MASSSVRRAAPLVFPAMGKHTATVIWAHGLGDTAAGWADAVEHWRRRRRLDEVKFVLPNAPIKPVTMNGGFPMPAWHDFKFLVTSIDKLQDFNRVQDTAGILESREYIHNLVQEEISSGISADRIVLGGFSQGGAMSILSDITAPVKIAGIVALSSYFLLQENIGEYMPEGHINKATPIFMGAGDVDEVVIPDVSELTLKKLQSLGYDVKSKIYKGMGHSACVEELDDVEAFLVEALRK